MKNIYKCLFCVLACAFVAVSCKDDDEESVGGFSIDVNEITIGENGGTEIINVSGGAVWQTSISDSWLKISPTGGTGSAVCEVEIDSSVIAEMRTAEIVFMAQGVGSQTVKVYQTGYEKGVFVENSDEEIIVPNSAGVDERYITITMTANISFSVSVSAEDNWLTYNDKVPDYDYGLRPRTFTQRFNWVTNNVEEERTATITITPDEGDNVLVLNVRQSAAPTITDDRAGDSLAILSIYESLNGMFEWDSSENLRNWSGVELWRATDEEAKNNPDLVGRLKSVSFSMFATTETLPYQVKYLKTAKSLTFTGNTNTFIKSIELGSDICELGQYGNLKSLTISAYGLISLPDNFAEALGGTLESLNLGSNNFDLTLDSDGLDQLTQENFPNLKSLSLTKINRYDATTDLTEYASTNDSIGYRMWTGYGSSQLAWTYSDNDFFKRLLQWDTLEELSLSYCLLQGALPSNDELEALWTANGGERFTEEYLKGEEAGMTDSEITFYRDSIGTSGTDVNERAIQYWAGKPKVWPRMKTLSLNLCFLTGSLPDWMLYHPRFSDWNPLQMITQQTISGSSDYGLDTMGNEAGFDNEPSTLNNYSNTGVTDELLTDDDGAPISYYEMFPNKTPTYSN